LLVVLLVPLSRGFDAAYIYDDRAGPGVPGMNALVAGAFPGRDTNATRAASVGIRSLSGAGDEIAGALGRSRVTIRTSSGRYHVDLRGRAHFDKALGEYVSTPHVRFDTLRRNPSDPSLFNFVRGPVRPATWQDIRIVEEYLMRTGQL
jgi:hypothetical protein